MKNKKQTKQQQQQTKQLQGEKVVEASGPGRIPGDN